MIRFCLTAAAAFGIMTGVCLAQTSTSTTTSTQSTLPVTPPVYGSTENHSSERSVDSNGVVTDKTKTYTSGVGITPDGEAATIHQKTETTTVR